MNKSTYYPADYIDSAGGCYISGVDAGYIAILFEFEYRELS